MKAILFFLAVSGSSWAVWWKIDAKVEKVATAANERIKDAEEKAAKDAADLAEHKLHAAETFATKDGMLAQTAQIMRAIETIGNRLDSGLAGLSDRLDRLYENPPRRPTRAG